MNEEWRNPKGYAASWHLRGVFSEPQGPRLSWPANCPPLSAGSRAQDQIATGVSPRNSHGMPIMGRGTSRALPLIAARQMPSGGCHLCLRIQDSSGRVSRRLLARQASAGTSRSGRTPLGHSRTWSLQQEPRGGPRGNPRLRLHPQPGVNARGSVADGRSSRGSGTDTRRAARSAPHRRRQLCVRRFRLITRGPRPRRRCLELSHWFETPVWYREECASAMRAARGWRGQDCAGRAMDVERR